MKKPTLPNIFDILLAMIGVSLCGIGAGFANCAALGMDSIGIFYDGIREILGLSSDKLGIASFIVSAVIISFLFFVARKYVSFGTVVYILGYGSFISIGDIIYNTLFADADLPVRIIVSILGYFLLYIGISIYIAIDIGTDAFTGLVLFLTDKTHFQMKYVKIVFDIFLIIIGALLGGALGVPTILTMILAGPFIQFFSKQFQKMYFKVKLKKEKALKKTSDKQN